ncbi:unnamed protein product, partial [Symbiodinium microadriaticum]
EKHWNKRSSALMRAESPSPVPLRATRSRCSPQVRCGRCAVIRCATMDLGVAAASR